jgi:hypothetical protein
VDASIRWHDVGWWVGQVASGGKVKCRSPILVTLHWRGLRVVKMADGARLCRGYPPHKVA